MAIAAGSPVGLSLLVEASRQAALTRSRRAKAEALASAFRTVSPREAGLAAAYLAGEIPQRLGVGWATVWSIEVVPVEEPSLSVVGVDDCFAALASVAGAGSHTERHHVLAALLGRCTVDETDFLRRLITGELRHGALAGVVGDAVALATGVPVASVRRAAMLTGSLSAAAEVAVTSGRDGLDRVGMAVLTPVQPMLSSPSPGVADAVIDMGVVSVEWKLDGIRVQVHRHDAQVRVFTRNLNDVTDRFAELCELMRSLPTRRYILDGELIGMREDDLPLLFQDTASTFASHVDVAVALRPYFFDILHADGVDLIDQPLAVRRVHLRRVVGEYAIPTLVTDDPAEAAAFGFEALRAGHEGVVIKDDASLYEAGRRGKSWRKVKPVHTLDLIVLGAEWGHGRRQGWLSNLHLGARSLGGGPPVMVGKTFKGLTDELLTWQTGALQARAVSDVRGVVKVHPELVVEIAVDGVQRSTRYPGGVALRFARVKRYRPDRSADDADTIDAVRALLTERFDESDPR